MDQIYELDKTSIPRVAQLMTRIKPEFWDEAGATKQLQGGVGWYIIDEWDAMMGEDEEQPKGWLLCRCFPKYKVMEIECMGYDEDGTMVIDYQLEPLILHAMEVAIEQGFRMLRFVIGSRGLSIHGKQMGSASFELQYLHVIDRPEFEWFLDMGFDVCGLLPNAYGEGHHGVELIKQI